MQGLFLALCSGATPAGTQGILPAPGIEQGWLPTRQVPSPGLVLSSPPAGEHYSPRPRFRCRNMLGSYSDLKTGGRRRENKIPTSCHRRLQDVETPCDRDQEARNVQDKQSHSSCVCLSRDRGLSSPRLSWATTMRNKGGSAEVTARVDCGAQWSQPGTIWAGAGVCLGQLLT